MRYITIAAMFFVAGLIIFKTYPNFGKFKYNYAVEKPWEYDALTAPFAFEIMKSKEDVKREEDSLLSDFNPFFINDEGVSGKYISLLNEKFGKEEDDAADDYKTTSHGS